MLIRLTVVLLLFAAAPAAHAQSAVCCNLMVDVGGKWIGTSRNCAESLAGAPADRRAKACAALARARITCPDAQPYCPACDQEALRKAREDRDRWRGVYQDQRKNLDFLNQEAEKVAEAASKLFTEYFGGQIKRLALTILKRSEVIKKADRARSVYGSLDDRDAAIKEAVGILKDLSTVVKGGAWKKAAPVANVISMLFDIGIMDAKMFTVLKEFERYAKEAQKTSEAMLDALKKWREAEERLAALEKQCRDAESAGKPKPKPAPERTEDDFKPSGQRELEEAIKLRDTWRKVDGMYEDTKGNLHSGDAALQEALRIIQSQQTSALDSGLLRVASSPDRTVEAGDLMAEGFDRLARGLEAFRGIEPAIKNMRRTAAERKP